MPIARRAPEVDSITANRLKSIDAFGQPQGAQAMSEAKHFVYYGWVDEKEWSLTPSGKAALDRYTQEKQASIQQREAKSEQARLTAR